MLARSLASFYVFFRPVCILSSIIDFGCIRSGVSLFYDVFLFVNTILVPKEKHRFTHLHNPRRFSNCFGISFCIDFDGKLHLK